MNLYIDSAIFERQSNGGISKIWRHLIPLLGAEFSLTNMNEAAVFVSTYFRRAPLGMPSLVLVYDMIAERFQAIGPHHPDSVDKRRAIAEATRIVAISQRTASDVQFYTGRAVDAVAYPGIERDYGVVMASAVERFQAYVGKPYILIVGNRGLYKNVQTLYQAWPHWGKRDKYAIVCVGGEAMLPQDEAFDKQFPGTRKVVQLTDEELPVVYSGAAALVYPSIMEGFGMPPLEALACGCPVIASGDALGEVCGLAALYADVTRPREIVRALDCIEEVPRPMNAARYDKFSWDGMAKTMAEVIRSTI